MKGPTWIALALAAVAFFAQGRSIDMPDLGGLLDLVQPAPAVEVAEPSAAMQAVVQPIRGVAESGDAETCAQLAALYVAMADAVRRHGEPLSTPDVRAWLIDADTYRLQGTDLVGALPGFGAAKDSAIAEVIGLESRTLEPAEKAKLAELLGAIAWALGG